jgi:hypothetical protein
MALLTASRRRRGDAGLASGGGVGGGGLGGPEDPIGVLSAVTSAL